MIRVLHVIGSLNSGGSQSMIMNIYRNLDRKQIQFDFIVDRKNENFYANEIEKLGGRIYILPQYRLYNHFQYIREWNKFFKEHLEYTIIHGHVRSTAAIYLKIAKKYGLYAIAHSHSTSSGNGIRAIIKNVLQFKIRYIADYFMGCSKEANEWLFGKRVANSDKCIVLNNAVDIMRFLPNNQTRNKIRNEINVKDNEILLGNVGRFIKSKNHEFLLKVFNEYNMSTNKNSKLLLIGEGKTKKKILKIIKKKRMEDKVILKNTVRNVQDYYNAMDLFVFPSLYEGLGMVLIEAQLTQKKVIAADGIPKDTRISNYIKYLPLKEGYKYWAKNCQKILDLNVSYKINQEKLKLYDIKEQVKIIQKIYLDNYKNGRKDE